MPSDLRPVRRRDVPRDAGQAALDYLGVVAVVAVILTAVGAVTLGPAIANGLGEAFQTALCRVTGDSCPALVRPVCVLRTTGTEATAAVKVAIIKVGRTTALLRSERSDGTVELTLLDKVDGAVELKAGADGHVAIGGHEVGASALAQAALTAQLGGGSMWRVPDRRAADRLQHDLIEVVVGRTANHVAPLVGPALGLAQKAFGVGSGKHLPPATSRIGSARAGLKAELKGPMGAELELATGVILGATTDRLAHTRTVYLQPELTAGATLLAGMAGLDGAVEVRLGLTVDRDRRPLTLAVSGIGRVDASKLGTAKVSTGMGRGRQVQAVATLDLTDPENTAAVTRLLRALAPGGAPDRPAAAWALGRAFADHARIDVATYGRRDHKYGIGAEAGLGAGAGFDVGVARHGTSLLGAWTRPAGGAWEPRTDCLEQV